MEKIKLYVDFDNTMVATNKVAVEMLNETFGMHEDYRNLYKYDFTDLFPECTENIVNYMFQSDRMFERLTPFDGCMEILQDTDNFEVKVVTIGTTKNLDKKNKWLTEHFKHPPVLYGLSSNGYDTEKTVINMSNGIQIDDKISVLRNSDARIRILFRNGTDVEWNKIEPNDNVYVVDTWEEIKEILDFYIKNGGII